MKFRKMFLTAVSLTAALGMTACGGAGAGGSANRPVFGSKEDVIGMGAMTTVSLLGSEFAAPALQRLGAAVAAADTANGEVTQTPTDGEEETPVNPIESELELFHKYFNMLDSLMGAGIDTTVTENADEDYAQYAFKMEIGGADLAGNAIAHTLYYNETGKETETEEDETETETTLEGVMLMFDREYRMEGEQTAESEEGETESGIAIRAYLDETNPDDYVEVEQETETEAGETETEYVYRVYRGGVCVEETAVEFGAEEKNNKTETEIELEFRTSESSGRYAMKKEVKDGKTKIKATYETVVAGEKVKGVFHVTEQTDSDGNVVYRYEFDNGWTQDLDKDDD